MSQQTSAADYSYAKAWNSAMEFINPETCSIGDEVDHDDIEEIREDVWSDIQMELAKRDLALNKEGWAWEVQSL